MSKTLLIIISGLPCTGKTTLGIKDREWSKKLGVASYKILYQGVNALLEAGQSFILESNFKPAFDDEKFLDLQKKYTFESLQIMCKTNGETLFERFKKRSESGERHPGHVDDQNYEEFKDLLLKGDQQALKIRGKVLNIDTTDFESIDYTLIFNTIKSATNSA